MYLRAELGTQELVDQDFIVVQGHDLQDVLFRIGMIDSVPNFRRAMVRINPYVACDDPEFLSEVWGVEHQNGSCSMRCLYSAGKTSPRRRSMR